MNKVTVIIAGAVFAGIIASYFLFVSPRALIKEPVLEVPATANPTQAFTNQEVAVTMLTPTPTPTPASKSNSYTAPPSMTIDLNKTYTATILTSLGTMKVTLYAKETPRTVNNFVFLAREGFYTATPFHRIISGFMIQGGDPTGTGSGGPGYRFDDEPVTREYTRGTIAMANAGPNTNGSQFFIMHADYALPKNYVIFGSIDPADTQSLSTLDAIAGVPVGSNAGGEQSRPAENVTISSVTIEVR
jgi:cyclophilin family peptidyl-prolyl cis-trans isomerase